MALLRGLVVVVVGAFLVALAQAAQSAKKVTLCHWKNPGWDKLSLSHNAANGHLTNHPRDFVLEDPNGDCAVCGNGVVEKGEECNGGGNVIGECESDCTFRDPSCLLPAETGPCEALIPHLYYDSTTGDCADFTYGGCQGNANNFETQEECASACVDTCLLPFDVGPCDAVVSRWYYDSNAGECSEFTYGGCEGNANNFLTEAECETRCGGV